MNSKRPLKENGGTRCSTGLVLGDFRFASSPWNDLFHIRETQNYNIFVSFLLISIRGHLCSSVPSRPVPLCSISSHLHTKRYQTFLNIPNKRDGTGTGQDRKGRNGEGAKMPLDGNKEEEEGDGEVIILCSTDVERVVLGGEAERKFTQNSSRETARSTLFRRTKRGTERFVPLHSVPSRPTYQTVPKGAQNKA
ncbi:hypothetical protein DVH24_026905 [Malus domestica]|uniref:Uncharacterized protein n=1 Tax=Malus domestica TaxID=3750 RepID=A0A498IKY2_MALDO|nr:hypothetical protein DVH24_026905 [Malus domestica]